MELLEFVKSIGGRIVFKGGVGCDDNSIMVHVQKDFTELSRRQGSLVGSLCGWAKLTRNLNVCYNRALADLAREMSGLTVSFDRNATYTVPRLVHTYKKAKVSS